MIAPPALSVTVFPILRPVRFLLVRCPPPRMRCKSPLVVYSALSFRLTDSCPRQEAAQDHRYFQSPVCTPKAVLLTYPSTVVAADGLSKREVFRLPDPFAVITVDAEQTHTSSVIKKTLNPYWNESFDM